MLALSSRNGIYILECDSLQSAIKLNPPMTFKNKWLWNPLNYCPRNCTKFLFNIHRSHSNQSWPYLQKMVFTCWSLIHFNMPQNSTHRWLCKRNGCGTPSIIVLQIVWSFFSRSILATQTNLSLILKKWYLHAGVWFTPNCHKNQPTNDFQEEMVVEPP